MDYPTGTDFVCPLCVSMSIAAYVAGLFVVWLVMVLSLGLALRRCLAHSAPADRA